MARVACCSHVLRVRVLVHLHMCMYMHMCM